MSNQELKQKLSTLLNENPETFADTLNELLAEEWLADQEDELLMVNMFSSNFAELLKNKIATEIGEKYLQPSKFSTLLGAFVFTEVIEKGTDKEKRQEIENNPKALEGIKEVAKYYDEKQGEDW